VNAAEQAALAIRLDQALAAAGLRIVRGDVQRGNLVDWEPVPAVAVLGRLATFGWHLLIKRRTPSRKSLSILTRPGRNAPEHATPVPQNVPTIPCGHSHPNATTERLIREARPAPIKGGCGKLVHWTYAYRCVECGVWMHRACLLDHFALHRDAPHDTGAA
jgi:hypothetical protein